MPILPRAEEPVAKPRIDINTMSILAAIDRHITKLEIELRVVLKKNAQFASGKMPTNALPVFQSDLLELEMECSATAEVVIPTLVKLRNSRNIAAIEPIYERLQRVLGSTASTLTHYRALRIQGMKPPVIKLLRVEHNDKVL